MPGIQYIIWAVFNIVPSCISDTDLESVLSSQLPGLEAYLGHNPSEGQQEPDDVYSCLAAVCHLKDIDTFIANVTVPPPPNHPSAFADTASKPLSSETTPEREKVAAKASTQLTKSVSR